MKSLLLTLSLVLCLSIGTVHAQRDLTKDAISVRGLFPNYQIPASKDWDWSDFTTGLEFEYQRNLKGPLNLAFPFKIGQARYLLNDAGANKSGGLFGLDALLQLRLLDKAVISPNIFAGLGANYEDLREFNFALPLGVGLDFRLSPAVYLSTKGEYRIGFPELRNNLQLGAGLKFFLGNQGDDMGNKPGKDSDKDGVVDAEDACPTVPGIAKAMGCPDADNDGIADAKDACPNEAGTAATNGCPDSDGDGIANSADKCPNEAGTAATNGCPDSDGDGIINSEDKCPTEAGTAANGGCPIRDADGDGIVDAQDECPNAAGTAATKGCPDRDGDGVADKNDGCPDVKGPASLRGCPDTDGDGVIDSNDRCPNQPGPSSNNGCPEITVKDRETLNFAARNVQFETGSAVIKKESFVVMDQIVDILKRYSDYNLRINGHTDSQGSDVLNQKLSENRAKACYDYLVSKGITAARMNHAGFGETKPVADNATAAGRLANRRTEFELYQK